MKKIILLPIILGSVLLVAGTVVTVVAVTRMSNSSGAGHIQNSYDIEEEYTSFNAELATADFEIKLSSDGNTKVDCDEKEKQHHDVKVENNTLQIKLVDERKWYEKWFDWDFRNMKITVYVPEKAYENFNIKSSTGFVRTPDKISFKNFTTKVSTGNVQVYSNVEEKIQINSSTGDVSLDGLTAKNINIETSTGDIALNKITATGDITTKSSTGGVKLIDTTFVNLNTKASTGNVRLTNSVGSKHIQIKTSTGSVRFEDADAETLDVETDTGSVKGTLLTSKIFDVDSDTGSRNYPRGSTTGGLCKIKTDTGDINISIK